MKPVTLRCGHSGCMDCLANIISLSSNTSASRGPCPVCRQLFHLDELHLNVSLDKLTRGLKMECCNGDCQWKGTLEEARAHGKNCPKAVASCPHDGCPNVSTKEEIERHQGDCQFRKIECLGCRTLVRRTNKAEHETNRCNYSSVDCPLGCGTKLPRYEICAYMINVAKNQLCIDVNKHIKQAEIKKLHKCFRGTQRENSSKPLKHSIVKRILVFKR